MRKEARKAQKKILRKKIAKVIGILLLLVVCTIGILKLIDKSKDEKAISLVINNNNVTTRLKNDLWINEQGVLYMSKSDIQNFLDNYIYLDEQNNQIITTYGEKMAVLPLNQNKITINGTTLDLLSGVVNKEQEYYLPISQMKTVYNMEYTYQKEEKIFMMDSLDKALVKADITKKARVKSKTGIISKKVDTVQKGEKVVVIKEENKWTKVRTERGKLGYVPSSIIQNKITVRKDLNAEISNAKINMVWDYYSEYGKAPNRAGTSIEGINVVSPSFFSLVKKGKGAIYDNVGENGLKYIQWAKQNNYKVWAIVSNNSYKETTSAALNSYQLRQNLINQIVTLANKYELDGINIDFENMNKTDKTMFSRFIIELKPYLKEAGVTLSVDVTPVDGGDDWSECYDRNVIGNVADYTVIMAYDQYTSGSKQAGTTAGYNWVEKNLKKYIDREEVPAEKIILGVPLYTRLWAEKKGAITSKTVAMKEIGNTIPNNVSKTWNEELKQYYVQYEKDGVTYKMWIEDATSLKEKVGLVKKYNLAGVAAWEKDRESDDIWGVIYQTLKDAS